MIFLVIHFSLVFIYKIRFEIKKQQQENVRK